MTIRYALRAQDSACLPTITFVEWVSTTPTLASYTGGLPCGGPLTNLAILGAFDAGNLQSLVSVVHGTPATLDAQHLIVSCQSAGGTTSVTLPQTPTPEMSVLVFDDGNAAGSSNITVNGNGHNLEDPNAPGTFSASVLISTNSQSVVWFWDGTRWKIFSTNGSSSVNGLGRAILAGVASTPNTAVTPLRIGAVQFAATDSQRIQPKVYFRVILETTNASYQANADLVDVNNVFGNGAGAEVPGSLLQTVAVTPDVLQVELNTAGGNFETLGGSGLFLARIWLTTSSPGQAVTCSAAQIVVF